MKFLCLWVALFFCSLPVGRAETATSILATRWTDQQGRVARLQASLGKHVTLMSMLYTSCDHTCPLIIESMREAKQALQKDHPKVDVRFVAVSFDTQKDTVSKLKSYMTMRKLAESEWTFLRSSDAKSIQKLANYLGVTYGKGKHGHFSHNNVIAALASDGSILARTETLMDGAKDISEQLAKLKKDFQ